MERMTLHGLREGKESRHSGPFHGDAAVSTAPRKLWGPSTVSPFRAFLCTALLNTLIALFLTGIGFGGGIGINFVFSQSIGLSICLFVLAVHYGWKQAPPRIHLPLVAAAIVVGAAAGTWLGYVLTGVGPDHAAGEKGIFLKIVLLGVFFGAAISYGFASLERAAASEIRAQEERIQRLASEKEAMQARLSLLQAQIEPHFLFNTLSNVLGLMEAEPEQARAMLEDLTAYLRTSLSRTRTLETTLGQEVDLVKAFLRITGIRMGDRLCYDVHVPDSLRSHPFPPLLVQPLVENAVRHGLEPFLEGGRIDIRAEAGEDVLRVTVSDTGGGMGDRSTPGTGLTNVRERLRALYGDRGCLRLQDNEPAGLKAVVEVPLDTPSSDHRG